jgi:beta-lactamase regulating signal transducer with metallopeptidase domain
MTLVMAYVILISAGIGAAAVVFEGVTRGRSAGGARWVWVAALMGTIVATLFAVIAPRTVVVEMVESRERATSNVLATSSVRVPSIAPARSVSAADVSLAAADAILPFAWLAVTLALLSALALGRRRFRVERRNARKAIIAGHEVLLTEHLGPAVAGVRRPVVFVPRWVLALDGASQQLLLAHEIEHVKRRDTSLLLFGAVTAAVTPWNPVAWWMVRRLRLAVEQDCDARVLASHPGIRRYADLLLTAASRHGLGARLLAAHFGEHTSDLVRRIEAMTTRRSIPWRRIAAAAFVGTALVAAACETPRPDPVAPFPVSQAPSNEQEVPVGTIRSSAFSNQVARCTTKAGPGCQISVIVQTSEGKLVRMYFGEIPVAHLPEGGIEKIKVEDAACGDQTCSLIWITLKPDASLPKTPLRSDASELRSSELVEVKKGTLRPVVVPPDSSHVHYTAEVKRPLLRSNLADSSRMVVTAKNLVAARYEEREGERVGNGQGYVTWRPNELSGRMPNVLVSASDNSEVSRSLAGLAGSKPALDEIRQDDIAAIEVYKGVCPATAPIACPYVRVWLKPGRDAAYRKR